MLKCNPMDYMEGLNEKQKEAVSSTEGPLLIVAGAGAGKTKTITHRIINLIHKGVNPSSILAVTFTNKAAKEMRERVMKMLENTAHGFEKGEMTDFNFGQNVPHVSTFHSLGVYIIKENASLLGLTRHFKILDEGDAISIIKDIMKLHDIDPKQNEPRKIKNIISRAKGDFISWEKFNTDVKSSFQSIVSLVWQNYERRLREEHALDFDDLLLKTVFLLKQYPEIKNKYQNKWKYVHIDEYQDTNEVQYEMTKLLVSEEENICVVGDTDQNIYSWRGANIKNILHFEKDYPNTKIILLEQNYRSTKTIIEAANKIINKNQYRVPKNLFTENEEGESIQITETYDEVGEANFVSEKIKELLETTEGEEIAILYRANFQSRILEESLLRENIPYQVLGTKFFERKEIKDVLSYIRASLNKNSWSDLKRIINVPARGIGKVTLLKIVAGQLESLPESTKQKINNFYALLDEINFFIKDNKPAEVIKFIVEKTGLGEKLSNGTSDEQEEIENIKELVSLSLKYNALEPMEAMEKLLEEASLSSDQDTLINKSSGVRLMTVHAAKGLEFKYVFVVGLEQDLFPHEGFDSQKKEDKEEERRLFYVAITRARQKLFLSYTQIRTIFGNRQVNEPSEFIYDIPEYLTSFEQIENNRGEKVVYL